MHHESDFLMLLICIRHHRIDTLRKTNKQQVALVLWWQKKQAGLGPSSIASTCPRAPRAREGAQALGIEALVDVELAELV